MGLEKSVKSGESRVEIKIQEQVEAAECGGIAVYKYTDYNNPQASTGQLIPCNREIFSFTLGSCT